MKRLDLTGRKFGKLTVLEFAGYIDNHQTLWLCRCECGNTAIKRGTSLNRGCVLSCGCMRKTAVKEANTLHGESNTRLYGIWHSMRERCGTPTHKDYKNYGARGIKVCAEWNDFPAFKKWAIENGYNPNAEYGKCTLDRIDVNSDYCPDNCRWVTLKQQANNRRGTIRITYNGETKTIPEWAELYGIDYNRLLSRLKSPNFTLEEALTKPINKNYAHVKRLSATSI